MKSNDLQLIEADESGGGELGPQLIIGQLVIKSINNKYFYIFVHLPVADVSGYWWQN